VGDATDKLKVPKSQGQEEVDPKDLQDRAVGLKGPRGQSADPKDPEDQEDAKVAYTSLLNVKVPSSREGGPEPLRKG
jgi:hypothetical protein